jgi:hypothetical protein
MHVEIYRLLFHISIMVKRKKRQHLVGNLEATSMCFKIMRWSFAINRKIWKFLLFGVNPFHSNKSWRRIFFWAMFWGKETRLIIYPVRKEWEKKPRSEQFCNEVRTLSFAWRQVLFLKLSLFQLLMSSCEVSEWKIPKMVDNRTIYSLLW